MEKILLVLFSERLSRRAPSLFSLIIHIPHHTSRDRRQQWLPLSFVQAGRSQHPSTSHFWRRTLPDRPTREKLTLREATSSALNTLVNGLPYQIVWLSVHAIHATSCKTCKSLYSQLVNGHVVFAVKARMLSVSGCQLMADVLQGED